MNNEGQAIRVAVGRPATNGDVAKANGNGHGHASGANGTNGSAVHTPLIDIHEGPNGLVLEADLPGVSEEDISVQLEDNVLSLHAKARAPEAGEARLIHEEFRVGPFYRSFILSDEVDRNGIGAELKGGVLRLTLPRAERAKTRRIEIKSS